jgi:hypothetical protein
MLLIARIIVTPIMVLLYIGIAAPLSIVYAMDWAFDRLGKAVGYNVDWFPLPRGQDEDFRFRKWTRTAAMRTEPNGGENE